MNVQVLSNCIKNNLFPCTLKDQLHTSWWTERVYVFIAHGRRSCSDTLGLVLKVRWLQKRCVCVPGYAFEEVKGGIGVVSRGFVSRLGWYSTEMYMRFKLHACFFLFSTPSTLQRVPLLGSSGFESFLVLCFHLYPPNQADSWRDSYMNVDMLRTMWRCVLMTGLTRLSHVCWGVLNGLHFSVQSQAFQHNLTGIKILRSGYVE